MSLQMNSWVFDLQLSLYQIWKTNLSVTMHLMPVCETQTGATAIVITNYATFFYSSQTGAKGPIRNTKSFSYQSQLKHENLNFGSHWIIKFS